MSHHLTNGALKNSLNYCQIFAVFLFVCLSVCYIFVCLIVCNVRPQCFRHSLFLFKQWIFLFLVKNKTFLYCFSYLPTESRCQSQKWTDSNNLKLTSPTITIDLKTDKIGLSLSTLRFLVFNLFVVFSFKIILSFFLYLENLA